MSDFDEHFRFRDDLTERLVLDILGPAGGDDEILTDAPVGTYLTGVLFPLRQSAETVAEANAEVDFDLANAKLDLEEQPDVGVSMANVQSPSSMGLTFLVRPGRGDMVAHVTAGRYVPVDQDGKEVEAELAAARSTEASSTLWQRRKVDTKAFPFSVDSPGASVDLLALGLELRVLVRPADKERHTTTVTVTVVNVNSAEGPLRDPLCFFQCGLEISSAKGEPVIVEQQLPSVGDDDETLLAGLLYRHAPTFATGHGCAADWDDPREPDRPDAARAVTVVRSSFTPTFDVRLAESNPEIDTTKLRMIDLATNSPEQVIEALRALVDGYRVWVDALETKAARLAGTPYEGVARDQARECRVACDRMTAGIELLQRDDDAMRAFQLANRAMAMQRARTVRMRDGGTSDDLGIGRWYPFQLGFILLCLHGIRDSEHPERGIADLLWFPTGGGKTEAYLGLVAFTVFLRRIHRKAAGGGVTVLMRYTLRLLTLQQFERAATLMCAMDLVRRSEDIPGEEISIGMWVGASATPNNLKVAEKALKKLRGGDSLAEENPVQLRRCPWCGSDIDAIHYTVDHAATRMIVACGNRECEYAKGLPVHLVDEAVYAFRPTLIIATVDKFAQMAWKDSPAALFNRIGAPDGTPPPELVIQDELHLISGPLGTLVGLYESALDLAADRPKVIASTATIRRAKEQGKALFDRDVHQFPPSGLDARNSWFAVEAPPERKPTRRYVGLFAPGTSQASLLVRAYAALLHHAATLDGKDHVRDAYWTLIGYFNSLRLLAAAELQVNDDVAVRLKRLSGEADPREVETTELTSRANASDIPKRLRALDLQHPDQSALDVVLATNMISVGVDVDRLGLMAITGQPQTTAEYIQATSRVGRRYPGLVAVLYNAARSRDRSHYERFRAYHSALYRQVESTSVTPFSARARDRALHAALISAARMIIPAARPNEGAGQIETFEAALHDLAGRILDRVERTAPDELDSTRLDLEKIISKWLDWARDWNPDVVYHRPKRPGSNEVRPNASALLCTHEDTDLEWSFPTMNSLRDVDVETTLLIREAR